MKRVVVAMSGGVDSSVAAALLQQQGHQVEGIFMKNWSPESGQSLTDCPWMQDQADAEAVCRHLHIPFRSLNFEQEYKKRVLDYFLAEYGAGRTPNPDILCNKEIKFGAFLAAARLLGADLIATGHYAQIAADGRLQRGIDTRKDQSYFLYTLDSTQLDSVLFPLGALTKPEVRRLAAQFELPTATKKDSQGICFIGQLDLKSFLQEHLQPTLSEIYLLPPYTNQSLKERQDAAQLISGPVSAQYYTIGERVGRLVDNGKYLQVSGEHDVPPLFLLSKNGQRLFVTVDSDDPHLLARELILEQWYGQTPPADLDGMTVQARYQQQEQVLLQSLQWMEDGTVRLSVAEPYLHAVASGQAAVIYSKDGRVIGGGTIGATAAVNGN